MKTNQLLFITVILMIITTSISYAQENTNENYVSIEKRLDAEILKMREQAVEHEEKQKEKLKNKIEEINKLLDKNEISNGEANTQKKEAAENAAQGIIAYQQLMDAKIDYMRARNVVEKSGQWVELNPIDYEVKIFNEHNRNYKKHQRTHSGLVLGLGYNYMNGDNLDIDDFSYKNNNFLQLGLQFSTRLNKDKGFFRVKYGLDMILHSTELNGNRAVTIGGSNTNIQPIGFNVKKAQFTQLQFVAPFHLVIGGSNRKDYEDGRVRFDYYDKWEFGLGGFAGFNVSSTLNYKFKQDGRTVRQETTNAFDTNPFVYGLDAYVSKGSISLFGRMNLNDVFKSGSVDAQYVSFGIRFQ